MATNEIAAAVQCGQADVLELWQAVRRFAIKQGLRWLRALDGKGGATLDDLEQCAFLAMLDALESWFLYRLVCVSTQNGIPGSYGGSHEAGQARPHQFSTATG
mgnify:CR=1 FL=1